MGFMARPVRMDYPDTFYHVLSRGNERRKIFRDPQDYSRFIDTIKRMVERFHVEVHAYVLMSNHYHLLIRTRHANLSKTIQWLGLTYSIWFNRRYKRSGHLFQGRFKSFVIENDRYFTAMCLYIHRNPLRARMVESLLDYPWSSYPVYVKASKKASWLTTSLVLGMYSRRRKRLVEAHKAYAGEEKKLLNELKYGLFLGSARFVEKMKERLQEESHPEKPQVRMALEEEKIEVVLDKVFTALNVKDPDALLRPVRRAKRPDRNLAIYILCHLGIYPHREIGRVFGVGYTSITEAVKRAEGYMEMDKKARRRVSRVLIGI